MPKVARRGKEHAGGGLIVGPSAKSVFIGGIPIALVGDTIAPHAPCPDDASHCAAKIIKGSLSVFVEGKKVARLGDACSCGHNVAGSGQDVSAGD